MMPEVSNETSLKGQPRILHIIPGVAPWMGGPTKAIKTIVEEQLSQGLEVHILTTNYGLKAKAAEALESQLPITILKANLYLDISPGMVLWLQKKLRSFDLVHIHSFFSFPCIVGAYLAQRQNKPYIIRPCGALDTWCMEQRSLKKSLFLKVLGSDLLNSAAALHVTSKLEGQAASKLEIRSTQYCIPLGFDIANGSDENRDVSQTPKDFLTFLFLARLHPKKNLEGTLESFARVQTSTSGSRLLIAGDGPEDYVRQLKAKAEELNIFEQCEFLGHVSGADKQRAYDESDVYLLPSMGENFGISVVEAMDQGLPVIISDEVGVESAVSEYRAGLVVPARNNDALVSAMERCFDPSFRATCAKNAKALVASEFEVSVMGDRIEKMYREVLAR